MVVVTALLGYWGFSFWLNQDNRRLADDLEVIEPEDLMEMGGLSSEQVDIIVEQAETRAADAEQAAAEERRRQREAQAAEEAQPAPAPPAPAPTPPEIKPRRKITPKPNAAEVSGSHTKEASLSCSFSIEARSSSYSEVSTG